MQLLSTPPATTLTPGGRPRRAAISGRTSPITAVEATMGGNSAGSSPAAVISPSA
jgi:hypothetical protein